MAAEVEAGLAGPGVELLAGQAGLGQHQRLNQWQVCKQKKTNTFL